MDVMGAQIWRRTNGFAGWRLLQNTFQDFQKSRSFVYKHLSGIIQLKGNEIAGRFIGCFTLTRIRYQG
jgi:hypothetical protein